MGKNSNGTDQLIPYKKSINFLGVILDSKLNWSDHIKALKAKANRSLSILRVLSKPSYGPDRILLLGLYWAICRSKIDFAYNNTCNLTICIYSFIFNDT